ncbi:MAG: hypothetical protein IK086_05545 [Clostridia bacterium]|nr:hypothetical protein [Clostridia bacterium]
MTFKRIVCLLLVFVLATACLAGCGNDNLQVYDVDAEILSVQSGVIAENDKLELSWSDELKCVMLKNKETGKVWSNIPYDEIKKQNPFATLTIRTLDMQSYQWDVITSKGAYENNRISCERIDNGVRVTYYYDDMKISVPVDYTLRADSLLLSIDGSKIIEGDEQYRVYYVSPAEYFCSVPQAETDAYILAPNGTGSIVNTTSLPDGKRKFDDFSRNVAALSTTKPVDPSDESRFQVFGIKDKQDALLGIGEDTAGTLGVHMLAGERTSNYSSIYPIYYFVDRDDVKGRAERSGDISQLSERTDSVVSVGFYPLSGDDADYNGMAKRYRKYLTDSGYMKKDTSKVDFSSPYAVTLLGGVKTTESVAGVPVTSIKAMTTFASAQSIISDITAATGQKPVVRLSGYGKSGINTGEIAGGYGFASALGKDSDRKALEKYCRDNNISLYTQFELIRYAESGSGFSYSFDAAQTATLHAAEENGLIIPLRQYDSNTVSRLLARSKLSTAVDKLISFINEDSISGVNLTSLGTITYSDYSSGKKYAATTGMDGDSKEYITRIINSGHKVSGSQSTYFAAGLIDAVLDSPLESSGKYQVETDIPFYQMVFSGITPLYSASINDDSNPKRKIMLAAASGTGLGFAVIEQFDKSYMQDNVYSLYSCVYSKNKDYITETVKNYASVYSAVAGCAIDRYDMIDKNISKTTFENGVVIYANHSSAPVKSPVGDFEGYGFKMGREG